MLKIQFRTSGAAFKDDNIDMPYDDYYKRQETVRILNDIAERISDGDTYGACMDINGNKVGDWTLE